MIVNNNSWVSQQNSQRRGIVTYDILSLGDGKKLLSELFHSMHTTCCLQLHRLVMLLNRSLLCPKTQTLDAKTSVKLIRGSLTYRCGRTILSAHLHLL